MLKYHYSTVPDMYFEKPENTDDDDQYSDDDFIDGSK